MHVSRERLQIYGGVLAFALLAFLVMYVASKPVPDSMSDEERADTTLGQHTDRNNDPNVPASPGEPLAPLVPGCALKFSVVPSGKAVAPNGTISYTVRLTNGGDTACENASFSIYYAAEESFLDANPAPASSTYYWTPGTLGSRESYTAIVRTRASGVDGTQIANEACATADNGADACVQNVIFVQTGAPTSAAVPTLPVLPLPGSGTKTTIIPGKEYGTWIWESPIDQSETYMKTAIAAASSDGFNAVYVTIDDYLEIAALPEGANKEARRQAYYEAVNRFVKTAKSYNIAVDVEGGARDWGEPDNRYKGYTLIDFVAVYNRTYPDARIRGLQYDVEAYLLPTYEENKVPALQNFIAFIDESARRMSAIDASFSVVIPHFYDAAQEWTPAVSYNQTTAHTLTHLLRVLKQKPGSTVIVMAYRDYFEGDNGTRQISTAELEEAAGSGTRVIVAQEMGNVDPAYVTYYGASKREVISALSTIFSEFGSYGSFGGVAVHYLDPFLVLK